jgi:hypothetical protein
MIVSFDLGGMKPPQQVRAKKITVVGLNNVNIVTAHKKKALKY